LRLENFKYLELLKYNERWVGGENMAEMIIPYPQLRSILEKTCELAVAKPRAEE